MKPSERINTIRNVMQSTGTYWSLELAIIQYLDEEYEKKQKEQLADLVQQDIQSNFKSKLL
jgi:hypothetical protein